MKLLVTGGAGYIGSVVTRALLAAGHEVEVLDDLSTGHHANVPDSVAFHQMSVHDVARVLTPEAGFEGVLHFAGRIEVSESVSRPDIYWDVNVRGSLALLEAVRAAKVQRMIFSSTGSMYRGECDEKLAETARVEPRNPYAASKLVVDLMLSAEATAFGLGATSLRYFNAAGAVGELGERHDPESHLIPIVLQVAAGDRKQLQMYGNDYPTLDGTCVRDYIHVADLAAAHVLALEAIEPGRHEIYNLGNGNGYTNMQVVEAVREVTGHPIPLVLAPRREGDAVATVASNEKAQKNLGWQPGRPDLHDIVADAWDFHTKHL